MNVRAGFDKRLGMNAEARLDHPLGQKVARDGAGGLIRHTNGMTQHTHELEIQARADQIDGGGDSHGDR